MGIDLTIYPINRNFMWSWHDPDWATYLIDQLGFDRDYHIFSQLGGRDWGPLGQSATRVEVHPLPPGKEVRIFEEGGLETTKTDKYGAKLTYVLAEDFKKLDFGDDASMWNKAIKAFIDNIPDHTPIILMWR